MLFKKRDAMRRCSLARAAFICHCSARYPAGMMTIMAPANRLAFDHGHVPQRSSADPSSADPSPTDPSTVSLPPISSFDSLIRAAEKQGPRPLPAETACAYLPPCPGSAELALDFPTRSLPAAALPGLVPGAPMGPMGAIGPTGPTGPASAASAASAFTVAGRPETPQGHRSRRKKQCHICGNFYANLSTHRSTHLTPENRPHKCSICMRGFARNNDLLRHRKRHWKDELQDASGTLSAEKACSAELQVAGDGDDAPAGASAGASARLLRSLRSLHLAKGTYKCPYNSTLINLDRDMYPHKQRQPLTFEASHCHQTGVFSRCDTFKNHLKALHFEYPPGTRKKDRARVPGTCRHCQRRFANVDEWLATHAGCGSGCGYEYH
ncbi:LAMI_0A03158g1_1 [Lachancea mirantina]|uniref:LAMI_0A03158g1_1 n=1 Tax=Lachancea mirantina TaxID=1230905 RepID=A0A1G4INK2_9SACH|nr:LAMI_0A03158g1_1 [Lachancea mirantina]